MLHLRNAVPGRAGHIESAREHGRSTLVEIGRDPGFARWWPDLDAAALAAKRNGTPGTVTFAITRDGGVIGLAQSYERVGLRSVGRMREYEWSPDGIWHDGLLMDLLAADLT